MTTRPSYQACLDAGMSKAQTARATGTSEKAAYVWAKRTGRKFPDGRKTPEHAERLRARQGNWDMKKGPRRFAQRDAERRLNEMGLPV